MKKLQEHSKGHIELFKQIFSSKSSPNGQIYSYSRSFLKSSQNDCILNRKTDPRHLNKPLPMKFAFVFKIGKLIKVNNYKKKILL